MKNKNTRNYLLILIYGLFITFLILGFTKIYGSSGDWLAQHTAIPEHFRNLFYETGKIIPNFLFSLGGGQNIFNFSYYGLCSPFILITYLFPSIAMPTLIMLISIIAYIVSGMLIYKFFTSNNYPEKISLYSSLIFLSLSPITYHFHYHIMFVWYFPFLILSLLGVDLFLQKHQSYLLMFSIFLLILTNYYYSVPALIVIGIYALYKIIQKSNNFKSGLKKIISITISFLIPILLSAFILLPTAYALINTKRIDTRTISYLSLFIFKIKETLYSPYSLGISFIFLLALITNLLNTNKKKDKLFLNLTLTLITFIPLFMYLLNGFLYVRGKVLIPFIPLYLIILGDFFTKLEDNSLDFSKVKYILIPLIIVISIMNINNYLLLIFYLDIFLVALAFRYFLKKKNIQLILTSTLLVLITTSLICNFNSNLILKKEFKEQQASAREVKELINKIDDKELYRTEIIEPASVNVNKFFSKNTHLASIYSSTYNSNYDDYYTFNSGNNISYRNSFIKAGTLNPLFYNQLGVKYLITKNKNLSSYQKLAETKNYALYKNKDAYPLIYLSADAGSNKEYQKLSFPYNLEYQLKYPTTSTIKSSPYNSTIEEIFPNIKDEYNLLLEKDKKITYNLESPIKNKIIFIKFDMNYKQSCSEGDQSITINGVKNKLTCKEWYYYNRNTTFKYVFNSGKELNKLDILITAGKYNISNIHVYTMDPFEVKKQSISNLQYSKNSSSLIGLATAEKESYAITSFPYDKGFTVLVDGKRTVKEKVNSAFLGFKVPKGKHLIQIKYNSPFYNLGKKVSFLGFILLVIIISVELFQRKRIRSNLNKKS